MQLLILNPYFLTSILSMQTCLYNLEQISSLNILEKEVKRQIWLRGLSKKYPTFGGEKYVSYVTGLEP